MAGRTLGVADASPTLDALTVTGATTLDGNAAIGNAATDLIGFHGATGVDQAAVITSVTTTGAVMITAAGGTTTHYGFATAVQADAIVSNLNAITALLKEKGLMASS